MSEPKKCILVIDDEKVIRLTLRLFLEDFGYKVVEADNGLTGIQAFEKESIDLVLCDLRMPIMGGLEVISYFSEKYPHIPIIVVSGTGVIKDAVEALRLGAWDYLLKPVEDMNVLTHAVNRSLEQAELRRENRLYKENLEQAVKEARRLANEAGKANEAKSEFLANMSHEIRTPMNGILGMAEILKETELSSDQHHYLDTIRNSGFALLDIINDILDFSKIEAGKLGLEIIDFDLVDAIETMNDVLAIRAQEQGLEYVCEIEQNVYPLLKGDAGRLRQIITNLVGNSVKFTEKGEVFIKISVEHETTEELCLKFSVADTGIGISENQIKSLFEPFTQADASTTRKYGGTGLGLTISKRLSEIMNGDIGVFRRESGGTVFWFTAVFEKQTVSGEPIVLETKTIGSKRILIVDSNKNNRRLIVNYLIRWGCIADEAADASRAIEKIKEAVTAGRPYNVVLIDIFLPDMDGETLGALLKKENDDNNMQMILMAPVVKQRAAGRDRENIFNACLTKPIKKNFLYHLLTAEAPITEGENKIKSDPGFESNKVPDIIKNKIRILLAEDSETNREVAINILQRLGYNVDTAASGLEAVEAVQGNIYDIILMDVQMPGMDGISATKKIRQMETEIPSKVSGNLKKIPIIAMTAHAMQGDRDKCIQAGMDDYISKPIRMRDLSSVLEKNIIKSGELSNSKEQTGIDKKSGDDAIFSYIELLERMGGDRKNAWKTVNRYLDEVSHLLKVLNTSVANGDAKEITNAAHSLRGASSNAGATGVSNIARQVESAAFSGNLEGIDSIVGKIEKELEKFIDVLSELDLL